MKPHHLNNHHVRHHPSSHSGPSGSAELPPASPSSPPPTTGEETAAPPRTRGYFNQSQLEDLDLAESVLAAARAHPAEMTDRDLTTEWLEACAAVIAEARGRSTGTGQSGTGSKKATTSAAATARSLVTALKQIQSAAKQKHWMLAEDGDPATSFPTDGYLIGSRLDASRALLLQSADALITRAAADSLPGFRTPEKITAVETLLHHYRATEDSQQDAVRGKELSRIDRDSLLHTLNHRRAAIQHAADALWPPAIEENRPVRKTFALPLNRTLGL
ncbi:MAG: hypothetical protein V4726_21110 [Verrucomicrobiota bacterium]